MRRIFLALATLTHKPPASAGEQITAYAVIAGTAQKTSLAGAGGGVLASWFLSNQFFGLMGMVVAILGLIANVFFKLREQRICREQQEKEDRRKQQWHDLRMQRAQAYMQQRSQRCQSRHGQEEQP